MIRKPPETWKRRESAAVGAVRTAGVIAHGSVTVTRTGALYVRALILWGFAALWGCVALGAGAAGSMPTLIGVGTMAFGAAWAGRRVLVKARARS